MSRTVPSSDRTDDADASTNRASPKPLRVFGGDEAFHRPFPLAGRLVGFLRPVVQILRSTVLHTAHQPTMGRTVAGQLVGDQHPRRGPQPPQQLTKEPGGGLGVTPGGDQNVQHDTVLVNGPPQVL